MRLSLQQRHAFACQLTFMLEAGVPLVRALEALTRSVDPRLAQVAEEVATGVGQGSALSAAMREAFDPMTVGLVRLGEESGRLVAVLQVLTERLRWLETQRSALLSAVTYPAFLLAFTGATSLYLACVMLPNLLGVLEGTGVELPGPTRLLQWVTRPGVVVQLAALVGLTVAGLVVFRERPAVVALRDWMTFSLPILGRVNRGLALMSWCRDLGLLVDTGVPVERALFAIAENGTGWPALDGATELIRRRLTEGLSLAEATADCEILGGLVRMALELGDHAGGLPRQLTMVARFLEDEVQLLVARVLDMLEPTLVAFMGVVVGGVVLAAFLPIYQFVMTTM